MDANADPVLLGGRAVAAQFEGNDVKIERVDIVVTGLTTRVRRTLSSGPYDTGEPSSQMGKPVLVRIHADGVVGYGQVRPISPGHFVPETAHSVVAAIREVYGPYLIGKDVRDMDQIWADFDGLLPGNSNARAALDYALYDAMGKAQSTPVHKLIGGLCQQQLPLEWSVSLGPRSQMVDDAVKAVSEFGIRVLCLKAGSPSGWRDDVGNFTAVRVAVGPDVVIGVDPNTGWHVNETLSAMRALDPMGLGYVEQPIHRRDIAGLRRIRDAADGVPIMADESLFTLDDALELARADAVDVLCIKLYKTGGIRAAKRIAAIAEAARMRVNIGGLAVQSQLEAAAGAHFGASIPAAQMLPGSEFIFGLGAIAMDPLVGETDFVVRDGQVTPPRGPGLGVTIDESAVARLQLHSVSVT